MDLILRLTGLGKEVMKKAVRTVRHAAENPRYLLEVWALGSNDVTMLSASWR